MAWRGRPEAGALALLALVLCARGAQGRTLLWHSAVVGLEYVDPRTNRTVRSVSESGRFGDGSPREPRRGLVGVLRAPGGDPGGCAPDMRFLAPAALAPWVALVARRDCPLRGLALAAARGNASALVVYGEEEEEKRGEHLAASPAHAGTGNIVVVVVSYPKGREIVDLVQRGILVRMTIQIGGSHMQLADSHQPFVFAFITVMILSSASLVFYCVQYFLYTGSPLGNQSHRKKSKKVIGRLPLCTVKHGEKGVDVDAENCAVCIENFKVNDLIRILPCRHIFHSTCIDPWLLDHRTCPMCKLDVIKALGYWGEPESAQELSAAESVPGSVSAETLSGVLLEEDTSVSSHLLSPSLSSSMSPSEPGPQCSTRCAEDTGEDMQLLGDCKADGM
ncbi:E3 ubiquitin-protein ligase RNF149 isoform X2 [Cavia porcellus]|uniref:E3 ubiquitin-protein ligase RNF149 isoform X2 n=1 Tax=Cavia porcellus TaxID=10141 RepID=UPI002FDF8EAA